MQDIVSRLELLNLEESQKTIRDIELSFESLTKGNKNKGGMTQENVKQHLFEQCRENVLKLCKENRRLRREMYNIRMYVKYLLECENFPENRIPQWVK
jgi:hypothetical protein